LIYEHDYEEAHDLTQEEYEKKESLDMQACNLKF
jgi:hypothetical protein